MAQAGAVFFIHLRQIAFAFGFGGLRPTGKLSFCGACRKGLFFWFVDMRGVAEKAFRRFHDSLRKGRVRMDAFFQVGDDGSHFDRQDSLGDHLSGAGPNDRNA